QGRDDMIQLHNPREHAAGIGVRPGAPNKDPAPSTLSASPVTPRAHARGVRFCAEGGFHVWRATAGRAPCSVPDEPGAPPALPTPHGTGRDGPRRRTGRAADGRHHAAADEARKAGREGPPVPPVRIPETLIQPSHSRAAAAILVGRRRPRSPGPAGAVAVRPSLRAGPWWPREGRMR